MTKLEMRGIRAEMHEKNAAKIRGAETEGGQQDWGDTSLSYV